jgi:hypothetical protein
VELLKSGAANAYLGFADSGTTDQTGLSVRIGSSGNNFDIQTGGTTTRARFFASGGLSLGNTTDPGATNLSVTGKATIQGLTIGLGSGNIAGNTALGVSALNGNSTGTGNSGGAYQSLYTNSTGANNTAFGASSLYLNTASNNSAFGNLAGYNNSSGSANVMFGYKAGYDNTTSSQNVFIGGLSGQVQATGFQNIYIGYSTTSSAAGASNEIVIGQGSTGKGSNTGFFNPNGGGVYQGNNSAAWSITSDARIKENVTTLENGLATILALRPVEFNYIETKKHDISFIAQEYQKVLPKQIIKHAPNKIEKDLIGDDEEVLGIQQNLVPYLVKALQELNNKFDAYVASHP